MLLPVLVKLKLVASSVRVAVRDRAVDGSTVELRLGVRDALDRRLLEADETLAGGMAAGQVVGAAQAAQEGRKLPDAVAHVLGVGELDDLVADKGDVERLAEHIALVGRGEVKLLVHQVDADP